MKSPKEIASLFGVSERTIHRWIESGMPKLQAAPGHAIRIDYQDARRWLEAQGGQQCQG